MRGLTLIRPMSAAIVHGTKRIENRPANLPRAMRGVRTVVAVHGGKKWNIDYAMTVLQYDKVFTYIADARLNHEGIVGLMRLTGRVWTHREVHDYDTNSPMRDNNDYDVVREYLIDDVPYDRRHGVQVSPWYSGPFGYEIDAVVAFKDPIPCRGLQGFWPVSEDAFAEVLARRAEWLPTFTLAEVT